ncbi:MAG: indolepyruvate oxidoreductase subunit beta [Syntrophomonadaceae bacterium]|nr:indolepyruvate oxidoreductase subunit beta [Syntrophomonadaceae bacterium]
MQNQNKNILIAGVGGQGTLLTSRIIARTAVQMGYDVKVSEVHGMAQRGGSVVSQVRYGKKVYSPIIRKGDADIILAFEKIEAARWLDYLKPGGTIIINNIRVDPLPVLSGKAKYPDDIADKISSFVEKAFVVDADKIAESCGSIRAANVVMVGIFASVFGIPEEEVKKAIQYLVPAGFLEINLAAFDEGKKIFIELNRVK